MEGLANDYSWVGRHTEAIALRQWILEYRKAVFGTDHPDTLACVVQLAGAYQCAGQLDTSMQLVEPVLEKQRTIYGPSFPLPMSPCGKARPRWECWIPAALPALGLTVLGT